MKENLVHKIEHPVKLQIQLKDHQIPGENKKSRVLLTLSEIFHNQLIFKKK